MTVRHTYIFNIYLRQSQSKLLSSLKLLVPKSPQKQHRNIFQKPIMYNLKSLLEESGNITIAVSLVDLKQFAVEIIESTKRDLEEVVISDKAETYPTPKQVCEILNVDASTLWRWNKRGYLCPAMVGGKRRYKMSEVKAMLNGGRVK